MGFLTVVGFEVPALNNWPGTHAHRFTDGHLMNDEEVIAGIIERMKDLKDDERKARFRVVLALKLSSDEIYSATGEISGYVPEQPLDRRMSHFPYRSLLFVDKLDKWFMDVTDSEEEPLGYRKAAVEELKTYLLKS